MLKFECCFRRHTLLLVSNYIRSKTVLTSMNVIVNSSCKKQKDCTKTLYYTWSVRRIMYNGHHYFLYLDIQTK